MSPQETGALDPHARRFLRLLAATGQAGSSPDIAARRRGLEDLARLAGAAPAIDGAPEELTIPGPGGPLILRRHGPSAHGGQRPPPGVVFLHGGGWCAGGLDTHDWVCRALAEAGECTVLSVDYRLAPEDPFPAGLDDAVAATRWASANAGALGIDGDRLVLAGDSAGGGLAAAAAMILRDEGGPPVALQLLICPILDPAQSRPSRATYGEGFFLSAEAFARDLADYLPLGVAPTDPRVAPLRAQDLGGMPPAQIHVAEFDPFRDEGLAYVDRLAAAGVDVELERHAGMIHYFYALPGLIPYARGAVAGMGRAMRAALA